jgi:alpha-mannosidase
MGSYSARMTRTVHIVPHTHWDREWFGGFCDL